MAIRVRSWADVMLGKETRYLENIQALERNDCPPPDWLTVVEQDVILGWRSPDDPNANWENAIVDITLPYGLGRPAITCNADTTAEAAVVMRVSRAFCLVAIPHDDGPDIENDSDEDDKG